MVDTVLHFPPSQEEVNLSVSSDRVWLRNHVEGDAGISHVSLYSADMHETNQVKQRFSSLRLITSNDDWAEFELGGVWSFFRRQSDQHHLLPQRAQGECVLTQTTNIHIFNPKDCCDDNTSSSMSQFFEWFKQYLRPQNPSYFSGFICFQLLLSVQNSLLCCLI